MTKKDAKAAYDRAVAQAKENYKKEVT